MSMLLMETSMFAKTSEKYTLCQLIHDQRQVVKDRASELLIPKLT